MSDNRRELMILLSLIVVIFSDSMEKNRRLLSCAQSDLGEESHVVPAMVAIPHRAFASLRDTAANANRAEQTSLEGPVSIADLIHAMLEPNWSQQHVPRQGETR